MQHNQTLFSFGHLLQGDASSKTCRCTVCQCGVSQNTHLFTLCVYVGCGWCVSCGFSIKSLVGSRDDTNEFLKYPFGKIFFKFFLLTLVLIRFCAHECISIPKRVLLADAFLPIVQDNARKRWWMRQYMNALFVTSLSFSTIHTRNEAFSKRCAFNSPASRFNVGDTNAIDGQQFPPREGERRRRNFIKSSTEKITY